MAQRIWHYNSTNRIAIRVKNAIGGSTVTDATVTVQAYRGATQIFSTPRTMNWNAAAYLDEDERLRGATAGVNEAEATAAESSNLGSVKLVFTVTKSGKQKVSTLFVTCIEDKSEG